MRNTNANVNGSHLQSKIRIMQNSKSKFQAVLWHYYGIIIMGELAEPATVANAHFHNYYDS